jgi:hypothetical protein
MLAASINPIDWKTRKGDVPRFAVTRPKVQQQQQQRSSASTAVMMQQLQLHPLATALQQAGAYF